MVSSKVTSPPFQKCFPHDTPQSYHWKLPIRELCNFQLMDTLSLPQSCFSIFLLIKHTNRGFLFLFFRAQVFGSIQRFFLSLLLRNDQESFEVLINLYGRHCRFIAQMKVIVDFFISSILLCFAVGRIIHLYVCFTSCIIPLQQG